MKLLLICTLLTFISCAKPQRKTEHHSILLPEEPKVAFTVTEGILHPESAIYSHSHKAIFVSNITSGNPIDQDKKSYISKLDPEGKVLDSHWINGLKAPKGLAVFKDHLYVSDVDRILKIDILTGSILKSITVKDAKFLNDVVIDEKENVYVSDMFDNKIYILGRKGLSVWRQGAELNSPNGLLIDQEGNMLVTSWGTEINPETFLAKFPGSLVSYPMNSSGAPTVVENMAGHFDGITSDKEGNLWVSDWISGDIYEVSKNKAQRRYNLGQGTADISYAKELGLLLVPQMNQNKLIAIFID